MEHKGRSLISSTIVFLGLLLPLRMPDQFWIIVSVVSIIAGTFTFWIFGELPNIKKIKEDWFIILFTTLFILASATFAYTAPHPIVQALLIGSSVVLLYFIYLVASRLKRNYTPSLFLRNIISLTSILGVFYSISAVTKWAQIISQRPVQIGMFALCFFAVFVISEFLFEVHGFERSLLYSMAISFVITQIVWISSFWLISYPYTEKSTNIGVPFTAVLATVVYYLFWGLSHHRVEGTLTKKVLFEYLFITVCFLGILILSARWLPEIK